MSVDQALKIDSSCEQLFEGELPATYRAAHLAREDENMFAGGGDKDVRRSLRLGEVPMPELAPDEVLLAVMASAINYNTVWSAMFEPISTFRFLEALGRRGGWDARHDLPHHVVGSDACGVIVTLGAWGAQLVCGRSRGRLSVLRSTTRIPLSQADGMLASGPARMGV